MAHERTCIVCSTKYKYCNNCAGYDSSETWRMIYHDVSRREIYKICENFISKKITAEEAKKLLGKYDLSGLENYSNGIKMNIVDILGTVDSSDDSNNENDVVENNNSYSNRKNKYDKKNRKNFFKYDIVNDELNSTVEEAENDSVVESVDDVVIDTELSIED